MKLSASRKQISNFNTSMELARRVRLPFTTNSTSTSIKRSIHPMIGVSNLPKSMLSVMISVKISRFVTLVVSIGQSL